MKNAHFLIIKFIFFLILFLLLFRGLIWGYFFYTDMEVKKVSEQGDVEEQYQPGDSITAASIKVLREIGSNAQFKVFPLNGELIFYTMNPNDLTNLKILAEQGHVDAQYMLGNIYFAGLLTYPSLEYEEAVKWYRLAAEQGHTRAQANLGTLYLGNYKGVTQDFKEAAKWNRLAAESGSSEGQFNLGTSYSHGSGVTENLTLSHMWFNVSVSNQESKQHDDLAEYFRNIIEKKMTSEQIVEGQELARECIEKNYKDCG